MAGLADGFLQGFGLVSSVQNQKADDARRAKQYEDQQAFQQQRLGLQRDQAEYERSRDAVGDQRWEKQFDASREDSKAANDYRQQQLGLSKQQLGVSAANARSTSRRNDLLARQQEMELAATRRAENEQRNRRYISAAMQETQANGGKLTPRAMQLAKQGGVDFADQLDPVWQDSLDTLKGAAGGAPVRHDKVVAAADRLLKNDVEKSVGQKTPDGREIISAKLNDMIIDPEDEMARFEVKLMARDKDGKISEYTAPITSLRGTDDLTVREVPLDALMGKLKSYDLINRAIPNDQIESLLQQQNTLLGGGESAEGEADWRKLSSNQIFDNKTSRVKTIEPIKDDGKRYSEALSYARKDMEDDRQFKRLSDSDKEQAIRERRNIYLKMMDPDKAQSNDGIVIKGDPRYGDVTEDDIQTTMKESGMTRAQVLARLNGHG